MNHTLVDLIDISKGFGDQIVLDKLNLSIRENEFLTLLGPSGCGKTTTLRILGGFETPDFGQVIFDGEDITNLPPNKRNLNTVFQKYALFSHMNIEENIAFGLKIAGKSNAYIKDKIKYALKLVNLEGFENRLPDSLSGGQQQRVAIARALAVSPDVLLFDEPTSALDPELVGEVLNTIRRLAEEDSTMVLVTHEIKFARNVATRILFMDNGMIAADGSPEELIDNPENPRLRQFLNFVSK